MSEETTKQCKRAINNLKLDVVAQRIERLNAGLGPYWCSDPANAEFTQWVAKTSSLRSEAAYEFSETGRSYEDKRERQLNIAEEIGLKIIHSIQAQKFKGVQVDLLP
ncbi:hypothetical protein [Flavimaricola marinus]|uniref:Uncharacterized protein n=1 Tax=Flavimaricola marinus TaxID=1819565 RepID=A0A238LGF7_9RHOB|nr:hypothetical protein [Flavimaricola marinus]SMY08495.1 hypothetical protein LOM8899_02648 [Flavimaricola marinus]